MVESALTAKAEITKSNQTIVTSADMINKIKAAAMHPFLIIAIRKV